MCAFFYTSSSGDFFEKNVRTDGPRIFSIKLVTQPDPELFLYEGEGCMMLGLVGLVW